MSQLVEKIAEEIKKHGVIPFARFMELALYCPVYGYYEKETDTLGRRGDYFTSVSVGSLFGELLACQFAEWLDGESKAPSPKSKVLGAYTPQLVEAGAHRGAVAKDILTWMRARRPALFERLDYWIIEPSERRRQWQQEFLAGFANHVHWANDLSDLAPTLAALRTPHSSPSSSFSFSSSSSIPFPTPHPARSTIPTCRDTPHSKGTPHSALRTPHLEGVSGIIFSNELLDSLPVHRLGWDAKAGVWFEWGVTTRGGRFVWCKVHSPQAMAAVDKAAPSVQGSTGAAFDALKELSLSGELLDVLPDGFTLEVCPLALAWWRDAARVLCQGRLLTIDYGLTTEEWLRPERKEGTLRAYYQHHATLDVLAQAGEQDLTAHINFSAIQAAGESAGLATEHFLTQAQFLTRIAEPIWSREGGFGQWNSQRTRQFQTLTHPEHLGRAFRVLVQSKP